MSIRIPLLGDMAVGEERQKRAGTRVASNSTAIRELNEKGNSFVSDIEHYSLIATNSGDIMIRQSALGKILAIYGSSKSVLVSPLKNLSASQLTITSLTLTCHLLLKNIRRCLKRMVSSRPSSVSGIRTVPTFGWNAGHKA
jgi:hypothetical protein